MLAVCCVLCVVCCVLCVVCCVLCAVCCLRMTVQAILEGAMIFYSVYWAFRTNNGRGDDGLAGDIWVRVF